MYKKLYELPEHLWCSILEHVNSVLKTNGTVPVYINREGEIRWSKEQNINSV